MQEPSTIQNPLLQGNQGNPNSNVERFNLCKKVVLKSLAGLFVLSPLILIVIWIASYWSTHYPHGEGVTAHGEGVTRRLTENDNIDSLPLLSISLLGLAAVIASTKTQSVQNFSLGPLFNKKTGETENDSKDLEKGTQPSNLKV